MRPTTIIGYCRVLSDTSALPCRLNAIGTRDEEGFVEHPGDDQWVQDDPEYLFENEEGTRVEAFPYKPEHTLIQFRNAESPEYLPIALIRSRLNEEHDKTLDEIEKLLSTEPTPTLQVEELAWYASRANLRDSVSKLFLLSLLRQQNLAPEYLKVLQRRLPDQSLWADAIRENESRWPLVIRSVLADPVMRVS